MSKGLVKACNKKNKLYKNYIKCKTPQSEEKYKKYKNKLVSLLRFCEKNIIMIYYQNTVITLSKHGPSSMI